MNSPTRKVRRVRRLLLVGAVVWAACSCCLLMVGYAYCVFVGSLPLPGAYFDPTVTTFIPDPAPFVQEKWDRGRAADRIAIGKWFAKSQALTGKSRAEVVAMLGPVDYQSERDETLWLRWPLGKSDAGGWPREWKLRVGFDHSGLVVQAWVYANE